MAVSKLQFQVSFPPFSPTYRSDLISVSLRCVISCAPALPDSFPGRLCHTTLSILSWQTPFSFNKVKRQNRIRRSLPLTGKAGNCGKDGGKKTGHSTFINVQYICRARPLFSPSLPPRPVCPSPPSLPCPFPSLPPTPCPAVC